LKNQTAEKAHRAPFLTFFLAIGLQLAAILWIFSLIAPGVFAAETQRPWTVLWWTVGLGLPLSLFEYLYHRYLLHSAVLPFMAAMHRAHRTHHGLTYVKAAVNPNEPAKLAEVRSEFPIEEEHQEESMMFPLYSLPIFVAVFFLILGLPLKWLLPGSPVLLSLILGVTVYLCLYEVWHAILHLPYERFWRPLMDGRVTRKLFRRLYGFHLVHHWRPSSNLAIVGFWGIALWDYTFQTHRRPSRLPTQGAEVNYHDATLAKPRWPISMFDGWQASMYKASRAIERFLARVFLRRTDS
jgi:hypothetical protein